LYNLADRLYRVSSLPASSLQTQGYFFGFPDFHLNAVLMVAVAQLVEAL
jgi:hypothetical protein